jgi:hypothetical protein
MVEMVAEVAVELLAMAQVALVVMVSFTFITRR